MSWSELNKDRTLLCVNVLKGNKVTHAVTSTYRKSQVRLLAFGSNIFPVI